MTTNSQNNVMSLSAAMSLVNSEDGKPDENRIDAQVAAGKIPTPGVFPNTQVAVWENWSVALGGDAYNAARDFPALLPLATSLRGVNIILDEDMVYVLIDGAVTSLVMTDFEEDIVVEAPRAYLEEHVSMIRVVPAGAR